MLMPQGQIRKFRKVRPHGVAASGADISFGLFGLKATEPGRVTSKQIEACRKMIARVTKKTGRIWIRCFPHLPVSKRPADMRMGGGKGGIEFYVSAVKAGMILFEIDGISEDEAKELFQRVSYKLPISVTFVKRRFTNIVA